MIDFRDRSGDPMTSLAWAAAHDDREYATIERTPITTHVAVITMWHGLDPIPFRDPPRIFGSIIEAYGGYLREIESATEVAARAAHAQLVELATAEFTRTCPECGLELDGVGLS